MKFLLLISTVIATSLAKLDWNHLITYDKLPNCEMVDLDTTNEKRMDNSAMNIENEVKESAKIISDYVTRKNKAQGTITASLIGGALLAMHRDIILSSFQSDLQKILSLSQIMQGYGYAMYQYGYITEESTLPCNIEDFRKAVEEVLVTRPLITSKLRTKLNKSLRCITRWLHPIKYHTPIVHAHYLQEMINLHINIFNDTEYVNITRYRYSGDCEDKLDLDEERKKTIGSLDNMLYKISKKIDEPESPAKTTVYGGSIIFGSLLQVYGQYWLDHQSENSRLRMEEIANYGSLALYGHGFGWPNIIESTLYPKKNVCKFERNPVETMISMYNLQDIDQLLAMYGSQKAISAVLEFKKVLQIRMSCYKPMLGDLEHGQESFDLLDELEEILLRQIRTEEVCPS